LGWDNQEVDYTEVPCPSGAQLGRGGSTPSSPPSGGSCSGVSVAFNPSERYWVEVNAPAGRNVQVQCTGRNAQTIQCVYQWGKYTCKPNGECLPDAESPRYAIVNGARCRLSGPARAEADSNTEAEEFIAEYNDAGFDLPQEETVSAAVADVAQDSAESFFDGESVDSAVADYNQEEVDTDLMEAQFNAVFEDSQQENDAGFVDYAVADPSLSAQQSETQSAPSESTPAWAIVVLVISVLLMIVLVFLAVVVVIRARN
jgi:hypothetical protein